MATTYNPVIQQNTTWEVNVTITNSDNTPFDLTSFTGQGQIKALPTDLIALAQLTVTVTSALAGKLKIHLPMTQAALLPVTSIAVPPKPPLPVYDVLIGNTDKSQVFSILSGSITVKAGVTHWTP